MVIEGINGAGKTTIVNDLIERFGVLQIPVSVYKFPNRNGPNGSKIDNYLKGNVLIQSKYEVLDMFAADRESVRENINADLEMGKVVICDRYVYSAIAYQIPLSVSEEKKIRLYCNVIGYFDKCMPIPDIVYVIEGDHLDKRGIAKHEVFHYLGSRSVRMNVLLKKVISQYTRPNVVKNKTGHLDEVVNYIFNDIGFRH